MMRGEKMEIFQNKMLIMEFKEVNKEYNKRIILVFGMMRIGLI